MLSVWEVEEKYRVKRNESTRNPPDGLVELSSVSSQKLFGGRLLRAPPHAFSTARSKNMSWAV